MDQSNKKNYNGILIAIIILLLCAVGFLTYVVVTDNNPFDNTKEEENNSNNDNEEQESQTLDVNSDTVQQLYKMVNIFNYALGTSQKYFGYYYQRDSYTESSMDNQVKLALGIIQYANSKIRNVNASTPVTISASDVDKEVKKIFGNSVTYQNASITDTDMIRCIRLDYNATSSTYSGTVDGCGGIFPDFVETKLISATKTNNKLEIVEKIAYFDFNEPADGDYTKGDTTYEVYSDLTKTTKITSNFDGEEALDNNTNALDKLITNYDSSLKSYKYTFTLGSDNNYNFTSVELVK